MIKFPFSKGPWRIDENKYIISAENEVLFVSQDNMFLKEETKISNLKLISQAPEMARLLENARNYIASIHLNLVQQGLPHPQQQLLDEISNVLNMTYDREEDEI